ncbi:MAG: hypothetical protein ACI9MC_003446, partial [Kiritimatiellia bacterium]
MRHLVLPLSILALTLVSTEASAARTKYTVDWNTIHSPGQTVNGVKITTTYYGGTNYLGSGWNGVWIGSRATNDLRIHFSSDVYEFCWYATAQNIGEKVTMTTSRGSGNTFSVVDTGTVKSTLSGNVVWWSDVVWQEKDETLTCVKNTSGFTWLHLDHNGVGNGLVITRRVYMDGSGCTLKTWYRDADADTWGS